MTMPGGIEPAVLQRTQRGDEAALGAVIERHAASVYRVAHGITQSPEDAEAIVQSVMLDALLTAGLDDGRSGLATRMFRAATAAALGRLGAGSGESLTTDDADLPRFLADGHRDGDPALLASDWSRMDASDLLSGAGRTAFAQAIGHLSGRDRAVLMLKDLEGLSDEVTADALGEPVASMRPRLHRARMALREWLTRSLAARRAPLVA